MNRLFPLFCLLWLACTESNVDQDSPITGCEPDEVSACVCPGGERGDQICAEDRSFGACACGDATGAGGAPGDASADTGVDPQDAEIEPADAGEDALDAEPITPDEGVEPECEDGVIQIGPCGQSGERSRTCADGQWSEWSDCVESCEDGLVELQPCGLNGRGESRRACVDQMWGAWSACTDLDVCTDGDEEAQACGANDSGRRGRICEAGQWGGWGECEGEDECVAGASQSRPCGLNENGRAERTCDDGRWGAYGPCDDPDECANQTIEEQACGLQNNGVRTRECGSGQWTPFGACDDPDRQCEDGSVETVPCGLNARGRQSHDCVDERWGPFGECEDPDLCVDASLDTEACGLNGNGVRERTCQAGQWPAWSACDDPDECTDGQDDNRPCGPNGNGAETRSCLDGQWSEFGACRDDDVCGDGATQQRDCDGGDQSRECQGGRWGVWSDCGDFDHIRSVLMVCGDSDRPVEDFIVGPLVGRVEAVASGCEPDALTQALLVTRTGVLDLESGAERVRTWTIDGGVVITELNSAVVYTALFDLPVGRGMWSGMCGNAVMPTVQQGLGDPFWDSLAFNAPAPIFEGCGYDLSAYPDIVPLGGWTAETVSLAYRPLGLGRVWLVEADWQDVADFAPTQHEPSNALMAAMIAEGHRLTEWPSCFDGLDNDGDGRIDSLDEDCDSRESDAEVGSVVCDDQGRVTCGDDCVDTESDARHCGGCGLICGGTCDDGVCDEGLVWRGIRQDVPVDQIDGWSLCYSGDYSQDDVSLPELWAGCDQTRIMLGCRPAGDADAPWSVLAMGNRAVILAAPGGPGVVESLSHNGVGWYYSGEGSVGFAPEGEPVRLNPCDSHDFFDPKRLCWPTADNTMRRGWRCGWEVDIRNGWERAIWTRD